MASTKFACLVCLGYISRFRCTVCSPPVHVVCIRMYLFCCTKAQILSDFVRVWCLSEALPLLAANNNDDFYSLSNVSNCTLNSSASEFRYSNLNLYDMFVNLYNGYLYICGPSCLVLLILNGVYY